MKILILTDVYFPDTVGGAGRVAYHLAMDLSGRGHHTCIITRNTGGKFTPHEKPAPNLDIHRFFIPKNGFYKIFLSEIKNSYGIANKISGQIRFDIICVHQTMAAVSPVLSGCFKGIPIIYFYHSPWHEEYLIKKNRQRKMTDKLISFVMRNFEKRILSKSERAIVLSRYMGNKLNDIHKYPEDRTVRITGGIDLDRFRLPDDKRKTKERIGLPHDKVVFLTIRNLVPRMGLENLIEAFLKSETLKYRSVLLIGGSGPLENHLKKMIAKSGLEDVIVIRGFIPEEDLPDIYQAADYFILPTERLEGFGLVILEAMACGTPVLGTPAGAIPEVIGPFSNNLLFDGTEKSDIQKKLEEITDLTEAYDFDPQACREYVVQNFSWAKMTDQFIEIAEKLPDKN